ncbi:hypothetical protein ABIB00_002152 [Bradyrhizobium sp. LB14.3]|uniref:hypothetical protein n=1 Tax=Bradyrhizobium sp. LB14.3 TaxID=3156328 RepID=UPI003394741D
MTKRNPEFFAELIDAIAETGSIAAAARAVACSKAAVWGWLSASGRGEPGYEVEYNGERMPLHQAVKQAQRLVSFTILEQFRHRLLHGTDEPAKFQGRQVFRRDPALDQFSDQDLEVFGITTRYLRDANGDFIPEMIHHEPSVQGVLALLAAEFPKTWGNKSTVEINSKSTGVKVVEHRYAKPRAPVPVEVLEATALAPPSFRVEDDLSELLGDESAKSVDDAPLIKPEYVVAPQPAEPVAPPQPLSPLQRELLARLKAGPGATRAAPVRPAGAADNFEDGVGADHPKPGGAKVL